MQSSLQVIFWQLCKADSSVVYRMYITVEFGNTHSTQFYIGHHFVKVPFVIEKKASVRATAIPPPPSASNAGTTKIIN